MKELDKYFEPQKMTALQMTKARAIRRSGLDLAKQISRNTPAGFDKVAAIQKVREATMLAVSSIAAGGE